MKSIRNAALAKKQRDQELSRVKQKQAEEQAGKSGLTNRASGSGAIALELAGTSPITEDVLPLPAYRSSRALLNIQLKRPSPPIAGMIIFAQLIFFCNFTISNNSGSGGIFAVDVNSCFLKFQIPLYMYVGFRQPVPVTERVGCHSIIRAYPSGSSASALVQEPEAKRAKDSSTAGPSLDSRIDQLRQQVGSRASITGSGVNDIGWFLDFWSYCLCHCDCD